MFLISQCHPNILGVNYGQTRPFNSNNNSDMVIHLPIFFVYVFIYVFIYIILFYLSITYYLTALLVN